MKYRIIVTKTAHKDLAAIPVNISDSIDRKIHSLADGLPGSVKKLQAIDFGYRMRLADYRIYLILKATPLRSSEFFIVAMRTLHQAGAKKGRKASINETAQGSRTPLRNLVQASTRLQLKVARAQFEKLREMFEDLCDAHELTLARMENSGKNGMTLNESRAKRGLQPL